MKNSTKILTIAALAAAVMSCSSAEKMAKQAENVLVTCEPAVLEVVAGEINATVTVTYPEGYFNSKAILEVTPVIVYAGGEAETAPIYYQGDKVKDNYKTVSSKGQTVKEKIHFDYVEGMEKAYLELRGVVKAKKDIVLPSKKVADGCNTTYMLVRDNGTLDLKADGYLDTYTVSREGQILYNVNSAVVRNDQLKSQSIKDFQSALDEVNSNERATITGTEIVSYASPEGSVDHNNKLSANRGTAADKAWSTITKGKDAAAPQVKSVGEDWEGFQELVSQSDLEDKDLILRVLSMYSDPAVRESEIRNLSEVYTSLKAEVLPELRRARFIANVEYQNYTNDELISLLENNPETLDEAALLRAASVTTDLSKKEIIYNRAIKKYNSQTALYNLAVCYLNSDRVNAAENLLNKIEVKDADVKNALGVVALKKGLTDQATALFGEAGTESAKANQGVVYILNGEYAKAAATLKGVKGSEFNSALAYILNDQLDKASATIEGHNCPSANYLKAIIAARQGQTGLYENAINKASQIPALKERAATDVEFLGL